MLDSDAARSQSPSRSGRAFHGTPPAQTRTCGFPAYGTASFRHRSINRNRAVASGSSFFNGWRSTPGTTLLTSQLALLISTTTQGRNRIKRGQAALRSLTWTTGQPPSVRMDDEGATTSAARELSK